jgi:hypothetical protein
MIAQLNLVPDQQIGAAKSHSPTSIIHESSPLPPERIVQAQRYHFIWYSIPDKLRFSARMGKKSRKNLPFPP